MSVAAPALRGGRKVVLSGFFGRGNAGDEAILQVLCETFDAAVDAPGVVIAVDRSGARDGFWDWYPYRGREIIHQGELARIADDDIVGLHVGGGGLPVGFNGGQAALAGVLGRPVATTGVDDPFKLIPRLPDPDRLRRYLERFDLVAVRSRRSLVRLADLKVPVQLGADWALGLATDESGERPFDGVTVVLRELPVAALDPARQAEYAALFTALDRLGVPLRLMPFCPEDERYLDHVPAAARYPVVRQWWNPRRCKEVIARSRGVVSIGRLHPLIFAVAAGTPAVAIDVAGEGPDPGRRSAKIEDHAAEFRIPYFPGIAAFVASAAAGNLPFGGQLAGEHHERASAMRRSLLDLFAG